MTGAQTKVSTINMAASMPQHKSYYDPRYTSERLAVLVLCVLCWAGPQTTSRTAPHQSTPRPVPGLETRTKMQTNPPTPDYNPAGCNDNPCIGPAPVQKETLKAVNVTYSYYDDFPGVGGYSGHEFWIPPKLEWSDLHIAKCLYLGRQMGNCVDINSS